MAQDSTPAVENAADSLSSPLMPEKEEEKKGVMSYLGFVDILTFVLAITCGKRYHPLCIEDIMVDRLCS